MTTPAPTGTERPLPPYHCPVCDRFGTEDDLCVLGEPCPDADCDGTIEFSRDGYMDVLHGLHVDVQEAILHAFWEPPALALNGERLTVVMDALNQLIEDIAYREARPWNR